MFKKSYLAVLLFSMLTVSSIAEETPNSAEIEDLSPIVQCDRQYDLCAEKCDNIQSTECLDACQVLMDKCYDAATSETDELPPIEYEAVESDELSPTEDQEESESVPHTDETEPEIESEYTTPPAQETESES